MTDNTLTLCPNARIDEIIIEPGPLQKTATLSEANNALCDLFTGLSYAITRYGCTVDISDPSRIIVQRKEQLTMIIGEDCIHSQHYPEWCDMGKCAPRDCAGCPHYDSSQRAYPIKAVKAMPPDNPPQPSIYAHFPHAHNV